MTAESWLIQLLSDIAFSIETEVIFERFKQIWDIPLSHGSKVLAITVPRATIDKRNPGLVERRNAINKGIMEYTKDGLYVLPLPERARGAEDCPFNANKAWSAIRTTCTAPCPATLLMRSTGMTTSISPQMDTTSSETRSASP